MLRTLAVIACLIAGALSAWGVAIVGMDEQHGRLRGPGVVNISAFNTFEGGMLADRLRLTDPSGSDAQAWLMYPAWRRWTVEQTRPDGRVEIDYYSAVGAPARCFALYFSWPAHVFPRDALHGDTTLRSPLTGEFVSVPIVPIWSGLVVNTAFFGSMWLSLLVGARGSFRSVRFRRRIARGRCPQCAFPRAGLPGDAMCPECGVPPPKRVP